MNEPRDREAERRRRELEAGTSSASFDATPNRLGLPTEPNVLRQERSRAWGREAPEEDADPGVERVDAGPALLIEDVPVRIGEHLVHRTVIRSPADEIELTESQRRRDRSIERWIVVFVFAALLVAAGLGFALDGLEEPDPLLQILGALLFLAGGSVPPLAWVLLRRA